MFTQNPTNKQLNLITLLFRPYNSKTIFELHERIPKNNKKYPDKSGEYQPDYRMQILTDTIQEQFTSAQASLFIQSLQPSGDKKILVKLFNQLKF
jgi:hypothetical protein